MDAARGKQIELLLAHTAIMSRPIGLSNALDLLRLRAYELKSARILLILFKPRQWKSSAKAGQCPCQERRAI
jgi:hypothetical protein